MRTNLFIALIFLIIFSYGCSNHITVTNNSLPNGISFDRFDKCIASSNYTILFPNPKYDYEKVIMECIPAVTDSITCDGIYYYRYVSRSFRQRKLRDSYGIGYSEYYLFVILDQEIYPITMKSDRYRKKFIKVQKTRLETKFGSSTIEKITPEILAGVKRVY